MLIRNLLLNITPNSSDISQKLRVLRAKAELPYSFFFFLFLKSDVLSSFQAFFSLFPSYLTTPSVRRTLLGFSAD